MTAKYEGSYSLGGIMPQALTVVGGLDAALAVSLPDLTAKVDGLLQLQASLTLNPPSIQGRLDVALALVESLKAAIALGLPTIDLNLTLVSALLADLQADLGSLQASAALSASISLSLGAVGVHAFSHRGGANTIIPQIASVLGDSLPGGAPSDTVGTILLSASAPPAVVAMGQWFGLDLS